MHGQKTEIAILDFGSQYTHLIARRVRELGVASHIYPSDVSARELQRAWGIILSGGPRSLIRGPKLEYDKDLFNLGVPVIGHCYGHQLMAQHFGGTVAHGAAREYGLAQLQTSTSKIFNGVPKKTQVWMSHGDHVEKLPAGFVQVGSTGNGSIAAMANEQAQLYGFQFHPEVHHSTHGMQMIKNFVFGICKAKKNWSTSQMLKNIEEDIKKQAAGKNVFLLVSGGVDSSVCFALLEKVLGKDRVYGLHIDGGFMRQNETKNIGIALAKHGFNNLHIYDAKQEFLNALKNVTEPEEKRKIIGNVYLDIADRIMREKGMNGENWLLGQGTIYPDTIESGGTKNADVIKTHHNRVARIQDMIAAGKIIEPIKELYKDEVRAIGLNLGLPKALVYRHPFPGPGLAIRCLCSAGSQERATALNFEKYSLLKLPVRSVGVQGDERSYSHPAVLLNPPKTKTGLNWKELHILSPRITNAQKEVNRVLLPLLGDSKEFIESAVTKNYVTKNRLDLLRTVDQIINEVVNKDPLTKKIWQMPVVLIPFGNTHGESIVLRPVESSEAMTVSFAALGSSTIKTIIKKIQALKAVDFIFYDVTNKPPGTIEWE
jgi:GMP synthase (glutamine-hydrolysing)